MSHQLLVVAASLPGKELPGPVEKETGWALSRSVCFGEEIDVLHLPDVGKELLKMRLRVHRYSTANRYSESSFAYGLNFVTIGAVVA